MKNYVENTQKRRKNALLPLKPIEKIKLHAVFDIESNNTENTQAGFTRFEMAGFYDGHRYFHCESIYDLFERILHERNRDRIIFAHNGGKFDFLFLFEHLIRSNYKCHLITQGSRVTSIKIELKDRHKITLQDSYALLPYSLKTLSDTFKPKTQKLQGSIDFARERVDKNNPIHRQYLEHDCRALHEILKKYSELPFIRDVGFKLTRSSIGISAWRTTLKTPINQTPKSVQNFVRQAYAGGRCEIFRQIMGEGHCFDANSLYPSQMLKPLPIELERPSHDHQDFGFHEVTVSVPSQYMPILWVKTPKLVFPTGKFRGTYFSEELKLAISQGAKIITYHRGFKFSDRSDLFSDYINAAYQLRKDNPGTALDILGKDLMNHTYGKFAEKEEKRSLIRVNPDNPSQWPKTFSYFHSEKMFRKTGFVNVNKYHRAPHMLCHIAAAITAYGRVHMAESLYIPKQNEIAYTDTDSGYIKSDMPSSNKLGLFKKEYSIKSAFFLLPKGYYIIKQDNTHIKKLKGFSKMALENISYDLFKKGDIKSSEMKLAGFRTALIRKNQFLAMIENNKSVNAGYTKRKLLQGGNTRPWHLKEGQLI